MKRYWPFLVGGLMLCLQLYATIIGSGNVFHVDRSSVIMGIDLSRDQRKLIEELAYKAEVNAAMCDWFVYGSYLSTVVWGFLGYVLIRRSSELRQ